MESLHVHDNLKTQMERIASHLKKHAGLLEEAIANGDIYTAEFLADVCMQDSTKLSQLAKMIIRGEVR